MDTLDAIMTAIYAGAVNSAKPTTERVIDDLYGALKSFIQRKYSSISLEAVEKKPDSKAKQASLREDLQEVKASEDKELLQYAQALLEAISQQSPQVAQAIGVNLEDVKAANIRFQEIIVSGEQAAGAHLKHVETTGDIEIGKVKVDAVKK